MLIHIARKEALEHLKSFRFLVAFIFIIATFSMMMFTRHYDYKSKYDDYLLRIKSQEEALEKYTTFESAYRIEPVMPPSSMETIVDPAVTIAMTVSFTGSLEAGTGANLDDNPIESINLKLDIIALVGTLGSLLALLLSYDSINREVNEGTAKLLLSAGVPRMKIMMGKILGGSLAATLPIAIIFLLTSVWLALTGGQGFGMSQWVSLLGIFVVSIVYIIFFYCLGALVSSVILDQTLSAFSCFGVWVLFVIVIPILCPYIAKSVAKVPDQGAIKRQIYSEDFELSREYGRVRRAFIAQGLSFVEADAKALEDLEQRMELRTARVNSIVEDYRNASAWQTKLSIRLSCISPYSIYLVAIEELSGMGFEHSQHLSSVTNNWYNMAKEHIDHKFDEVKKLHPGLTHNDQAQLQFNATGMPRFRYTEPSIGYKFSHALPYILLLSTYFLVLPFLFVYALYSKRRLF